MKSRSKLRISLVVAAITSFGISSFASGDIRVSPVNEGAKAIVEIEVPQREDVKVSLRDPRGYVLHSDVLSKNSSYGKVFDFSQVDDGVYTFITKTGYTTVSKTIELEDNTLSVLGKEYTYEPVIKLDGDVLKVNYLNRTSEDISIFLVDATKEYYAEKGDNSMSYRKMLNIENLPSGEYDFILLAGDKEYYYSFIR